jgi:hypothetical protein
MYATKNILETTIARTGKILYKQDNVRLHLKHRLLNSEVLEYLDLSPEELFDMRQGGVSIREYAESNGYSVEHLRKLMEKSMLHRLEVLRAEGVIAESEYQDRIDDLYERIERRLNATSSTRIPGKIAALVRASAW